MTKERSAGAVLYKIINNKLFYLVEYMSLGHISLPKGHLEKNESDLEAAKREIFEETSFLVEPDTSFKHVISYHPYKDRPEIKKDVVFFVAKVNQNIIPTDKHDKEILKSEFVSFDEAMKLLTHESDKETLNLANSYIINKEKL